MLASSVMQRLACSSLIIPSLIAIAGHSAMAQRPIIHAQMGINYAAKVKLFDSNHVIKIAQSPSIIDEKLAVDLVAKLPQVKRKAKEIQRLSRGTIRVATIIDSSPTPEAPYYTVRVVENHVDHVDTIYLFRVLNPSRVIQVYDILKDEYISLEVWKPN
ncbi:hypothetical protein H6G04_10525 [Calothrix membranacea FACHB-236]|nr:hypothetical protein [Calothrix membranacea FACHB-236]